MAQRLHGRDEHDDARLELADPADDVEELLEPHVGGEPALGDDVLAEPERDPVGDERAVAVREIREGPAVDEGRLAFQRLDEIRLQGLLEDHGHRAGDLEILGRDGHSRVRAGDRDRAEAPPQVGEVARDGDDRHRLGGGGDVEAGLPRLAVRAAAEADDDVAEGAVVHVQAAPPGDRERVDPERVVVQEMGFEHGRQQVVRGGDRVDVAGEVEVEVLHRHDLGVAAAGRAALDPEHGAERGLAQAEHGPASDPGEPLRESDRDGRLAFTARGRGDGADADELSLRGAGEPVEHGKLDLRLRAPVRLELVGIEPQLGGDLGDRAQHGRLGDLETRLRRRGAVHRLRNLRENPADCWIMGRRPSERRHA